MRVTQPVPKLGTVGKLPVHQRDACDRKPGSGGNQTGCRMPSQSKPPAGWGGLTTLLWCGCVCPFKPRVWELRPQVTALGHQEVGGPWRLSLGSGSVPRSEVTGTCLLYCLPGRSDGQWASPDIASPAPGSWTPGLQSCEQTPGTTTDKCPLFSDCPVHSVSGQHEESLNKRRDIGRAMTHC